MPHTCTGIDEHGLICVHDHVVLELSVSSERRELRLRTRSEAPRLAIVDTVFSGLEAYYLPGDNLSTILSSIGEADPEKQLTEDAALFMEGIAYGWPGGWNTSLEAVRERVRSKGIRAWLIHPHDGMGGWVWALSMSQAFVTQPVAAA
jgi:hypothetical protein